ncbi:MAG: hypothetical protein EP343_32725 [Deltaproteobacteria bacterium]|nr:MAG: hypothetical protein EP343_32725 [Deltaproteobacteria bacterium]
MKASLVFLEKLTLRPIELDLSDAKEAMEAGLERVDLEHAVMVGCMFNSMNRLVDAFGADLSEDESKRLGNMLNMAGHAVGRSRKKKDAPIGPDLPDFVGNILQPIREEPGDSPVEVRRSIEARLSSAVGALREQPEQELPEELATFVDLIGDDVWGLTDEHFDNLKEMGWSEEAIYEFVYTASMAAGVARLEVGWRWIEEAYSAA